MHEFLHYTKPKYHIFPECCSDTFFVNTLLNSRFPHQKGIFKVNQVLNKCYLLNANDKYLGIIDNDWKRLPDDFKKYSRLKEENNLILKNFPETTKHIILINPAFEKWIWEVINSPESTVIPLKYNYYSWKDLVKEKRNDMRDLSANYKELIRDVINDNSKYIITFKKFINDVFGN